MAQIDEKWQLVYDGSTAGHIKNGFGNSTDNKVWFDGKGAIGVVFMANTLTLGAGTEIRLTPAHRSYVEGDSTIRTTYPTKADKSVKHLALDTDYYEVDPWYFQTRVPEFSVEPFLNQVDATVIAKIWMKRIYPQT